MNKKKLPLAFWIFIGLVVGIAVGLALMMVPGILTLVPLFLLSSNMGILNSKLAIILPGIRSQLPFGIFLVTAFVKGLSHEMFEAAEIDGCTSRQTFWRVTLPLLKPILVYVLVTSLIGGLQMFDVPQVLTDGKGTPNRCATTLIMYLNNHMFSKNLGMAGAVSTVLFLVCGVLCVVIMRTMSDDVRKGGRGK